MIFVHVDIDVEPSSLAQIAGRQFIRASTKLWCNIENYRKLTLFSLETNVNLLCQLVKLSVFSAFRALLYIFACRFHNKRPISFATLRNFRYYAIWYHTHSFATKELHMSEPKVRLADIAKDTGYSLATVSKALNGRSDISDEARAAIDRALKATGYQRRGQKTAGQRYIEVVFQDLDTIWALEVLRGVLRETRHSPDISVITTESGTRQHPDDDWITGMLRRKPFGVIFIFANLTEREKGRLQDNGIPYVIFDPSGEPSNDDFSVQADNWAGGVLATRHLLALGHTRIGIITGPEEMMCSRARLDGYTSALAEQGIELDPELVTEGDFTTEGGYAQAMALLENPNRPTAIFAGSDLQAMGVYEAARQNRLRIPEDLSVVGFDDVQTSAFLGPALTTVRQPLHDMAAVSTRMLIDTAEGRPTQHHVILPTTLVVRNSTHDLH
ncbi:LacI family transcription regulator [Bifidobacterium animalis subsp. lactis ATCC 27536]|nr:LacI family transcription regulator [Bifidobacterium animalis subsp. lactis ATCC 27536]KOA51372.1 LacI family transcription regulator [Bifidobacterium animalis subsp. lactis ATCC 27674]